MRIGVKPGQLGLSIAELRRCWQEAEDGGFGSLWTFDHLSVAEAVEQFRSAGASRLVLVLQPPIEAGRIAEIARSVGL